MLCPVGWEKKPTCQSKKDTEMTTIPRKIVKIDEDLCDGCGLCVPGCAEGAIQIIDGKAKLLADNLCDGLGNCLGTCPKGAITIEERPAEAFDQEAVEKRPAAEKSKPTGPPAGGCPGSMMRMLQPKPAEAQAEPEDGASNSQLGQWPVQLTLVPTSGPMWQDADVLIAADCAAFAMPDFHEKLLAGKSLAIACPKLDNVQPYIKKLTEIFANNTIQSVTIAHMQVPCCSGLVRAVQEALARSGRDDIQVNDVTVKIDGTCQG
jgi:ferredoxin